MRGGVYAIKGFSTDVQDDERRGLGDNKRDNPQRGDLQQQLRTHGRAFSKTRREAPWEDFPRADLPWPRGGHGSLSA